MTEMLIPVLTFISVVAFGGGLAVRAVSRKRRSGSHLHGVDQQGATTEDSGTSAAQAMHRVGTAVSKGRISTRLRRSMARAGFYSDAASTIYLGTKLSLFVAAIGALSAVVVALEVPRATAIATVLGGGGLMFFVPNVVVDLRRRRRSAEIRRYLADAIDLMEVCVSAGMGLDAAWNSVGDEIRGVTAVLSDEMALTSLEINIGSPRAAAMRNMADRTGAAELGSLVALLVQAERFGTSVADALREFANSLRENRRQRAEETAEKMAVKLLFPMVLCLFPAMLVVLVGPAGINLAKMIAGP